jgi:hypothetical protein
MTWKLYRRKSVIELRPYVPGEDLTGVSVSAADKLKGSPKEGDMIARAHSDYADNWLVSEAFFQANYEALE